MSFSFSILELNLLKRRYGSDISTKTFNYQSSRYGSFARKNELVLFENEIEINVDRKNELEIDLNC